MHMHDDSSQPQPMQGGRRLAQQRGVPRHAFFFLLLLGLPPWSLVLLG